MIIYLYLVIIVHFIVIIGNIISFVILPIFAHWYEALPLCSFILWISTSNVVDCPLTKLENKIRRKLNLREIRGFIGFYLIIPLRKFYKWTIN